MRRRRLAATEPDSRFQQQGQLGGGRGLGDLSSRVRRYGHEHPVGERADDDAFVGDDDPAARHGHDGGTMVVINGPRFSTRAESLWFRSMGWRVVNMTGYPEAVLAAEAGIPYATVALVTDRDAAVDGGEPVTMEAVFATMQRNVANVRELLIAALPHLP